MFQRQPAPDHVHQYVPVAFGDHLGCTGCLSPSGDDPFSRSAAAVEIEKQAREYRQYLLWERGADLSLETQAANLGLVPHRESVECAGCPSHMARRRERLVLRPSLCDCLESRLDPHQASSHPEHDCSQHEARS